MRAMFVSIDFIGDVIVLTPSDDTLIGDPVCYQLSVELPCLLSYELAPT